MTLIQMSDHVYKFSKGHVLNGQKNSKDNFRYWFSHMFDGNKEVLFSMAFADGEWYCIAQHNAHGYDYFVPDTREQETRLVKEFHKKKGISVSN